MSITPETIALLSKAHAIDAARTALESVEMTQHAVALPESFRLHDLEKMMAGRRRARGEMKTPCITSFAAYVAAHAEQGCTVFIDQRPRAVAVLNLGDSSDPGHADHTAVYTPAETAAYTAMLQIANGQALTQQRVAEWMEDWLHCIKRCCNGQAEIQPHHAIGAVRSVTIEALRRLENSEGQLSQQRSALESVKASSSSGQPLPAEIELEMEPMQGMDVRRFALRLAVHTGGDKPALSLRVARMEQHKEEMAAEVAEKVRAQVGGEAQVLLGQYQAAS